MKYSGESKFVAVRLRRDNGNAILEVEDHGMGIPAGQRERIFERFYRAPNGGAKGGYGIGLFLVRHIMEAHSGRVEVESEPGRGSCFRLVFPVTA
jgi:two-component system phosphate regulon sensor histidine kinase PhoR